MHRSEYTTITRQLILSFTLLITIFLISSALTLYGLRSLSYFTRTIYNHPLVVSNAALQANVSITKMHRNMKDVVLFEDSLRIDQFIAAVDEQEKVVYTHLDIVENRILGEEGKQLEEEARILFDDWRPIREKVILLVRNKNRNLAAEITVNEGANHVALLEEKMLGLRQYARTKATTFMEQADNKYNRVSTILIIFSIGAILLFSLIAFFTVRRVSKTEKELQESRQLLVNAIDYAPIGMTLIDTGGAFFKVNHAYCEMTGYSEAELLNMKFHDITHPEDLKKDFAFLDKMVNGIISDSTIEKRYVKKSGEEINILVTTSLLRDANGTPLYLFNQYQDITELKKAEENLEKEKSLLAAIIENIPVLITRYSPDADMLYLNKEFEDKVGWKTEEMQDIDLMEKVYPDPEYRQMALEYMQRASTEWKEFLIQAKSGAVIASEWANIRLDDGSQIGIGIDVTEQKQAKEALRESEERFRSTFEQAAVGICHADTSGNFLRLNQRFSDIVGYSPRELQSLRWQDISHPDDLQSDTDKVNQSLEGEIRTYSMEKRLIRKDGSFTWVNMTVSLLRDENESPRYFIGVIEDINYRKEIEEQLRQIQKMESIGNLAGGIAHDFNNILVPIVGMSELLLEDLPPESFEHESAQEIFKAGKRGSDLVKQILAFSRQSEHKKIPMRIQPILKESLKLGRSTIPTNIEINQNIQPDCGLVMADPTQMHQVIMNLLTNANHAMEENGGAMSVSLEEVEVGADIPPGEMLAPGQYVLLSVSDTGSGVDPTIVERIFDPYFTTKEQGKGTGLGLAVVYGIIKEMGGDIKVQSELGIGTTFTVYLPLMEKAPDGEMDAAPSAHPKGNERILLVDDEEPIARIEKQMLQRLGYTVTECTSSVEALRLFREKPMAYDLVVTDMTMPNMTGDQLVQELQIIRSDIPVIVCTGFSERIDEEKAKVLGVKGLLMKPVVKASMAEVVRKVLDEVKQ